MSSGSPVHVSDVDSMHNIVFAAVFVKMELYCCEVSERHQADTTDKRTVWWTVDVQHLDQLGDEQGYLLEVFPSNASGRVNKKHHIDAMCASYREKMSNSTVCDYKITYLLKFTSDVRTKIQNFRAYEQHCAIHTTCYKFHFTNLLTYLFWLVRLAQR